MITLKDMLREGKAYLQAREPGTFALDADLLCMKAAGLTRAQLYTRGHTEQDEETSARFWSLLRERGRGVPVAYLLNSREFMGLDFYVDRRVLIPRPETELLVCAAAARAGLGPSRVLELGTGSGCVAVAVAWHCPRTVVTAADISAEALEVAALNAGRHLTKGAVNFILSDLFGNIPNYESYDIIMSNPPYISWAEYEELDMAVRYEPRLALDGGRDGLDFYRRIAPEAGARLKPRGALMFEIGAGQGAETAAIMGANGFKNIKIEKDLAGHDRIIIGESGGDEND